MSQYLAFKFVVAALLLNEAEFCSRQLHLTDGGVSNTNVTSTAIGHPELGFACHIDTHQYDIAFSDRGHLWQRFEGPGRTYITLLDDASTTPKNMDCWDNNKEFIGRGSRIDRTGAYVLASNWVSALTVDVKALETAYPVEVKQRYYYENQRGPGEVVNEGLPKVLLPLFDVKWGHIVTVAINGATKDLLSLRIEDDSFCHRPSVLISLDGANDLMKIADQDFSSYSGLQRNDLVAKYIAAYRDAVILKSEAH